MLRRQTTNNFNTETRQRNHTLVKTTDSKPTTTLNTEPLSIQQIVTFDAKLKAKSKIKPDKLSTGWYKFHHKYMSKIKFICLFLYLFVDQIFSTPDWCVENATPD